MLGNLDWKSLYFNRKVFFEKALFVFRISYEAFTLFFTMFCNCNRYKGGFRTLSNIHDEFFAKKLSKMFERVVDIPLHCDK